MPELATLVRKSDPEFQIFTGVLKAYEAEGGALRLSTTASSSVEDLHGDTMTAECVRDMAAQAKAKGMTIFLNHRYAVPEDVMGSTVDTKSVSRASEDDGTAIWDFDLDLEVNEINPRAVNTYHAIKGKDGRKGVKLGVSIGAMIEEWEFKDEKEGWWGGLTIKRVNLLEASVVGIPANPRSWVQNAVHALKSAYGQPDPETAADEAGPLLGDIEKTAAGTGTPNVGVEVPVGATATLTVHADGTSDVKVAEVPSTDGSQEIELADEQGLVGEINEETTSAGDGAAESDAAPETETTASEADETATKAEETTSPVDLEAAKAAAESIDESGDSSTVKVLILSLIETAETAIAERDAARAELAEKTTLLAGAAEIIAIVANTPLGRKTAFRAPVKQFTERFAGIYDAEFLALMERD